MDREDFLELNVALLFVAVSTIVVLIVTLLDLLTLGPIRRRWHGREWPSRDASAERTVR